MSQTRGKYVSTIMPPAFVLAILLVLSGLIAMQAPEATFAAGSAYVRVNQVGYINGETKQAVLLATSAENGATFSVINTATGKSAYSAAVGTSLGKWSDAFPDTYLLDFSSVTKSGSYMVQVSGPLDAGSPTFNITGGANLYSGLLPNALFFYLAQRDGPNVDPNVMQREPSHLTDEHAYTYYTPVYKNDVLQGTLHKIGGTIDASGGWFDAGDYIKLVETASYTDAIMLYAVRQYPALFSGGSADFRTEGKYGLDWLQKMWDNAQAGYPKLEVTQQDLVNDLNKQLSIGAQNAQSDPFGFGVGYNSGLDMTPHGLGYALEASFYDQMTGSSTYKQFGETQRNWVLGENAWGSSFIVGDGTTFPHCMQHQVANLVGSLNGTPPIVLGATVDGPNAVSSFSGLGVPSGARACPPHGGDPFKVFTARGARYFDNVVSWPTVEPADDYTALTILLFAQQVTGM